MTIRSRVAVVAGAVAVSCIGYFAGRRGFVRVYAQSPLIVRAYVMEQYDFVVKDGNEVVTARYTTSRRQDGSTVMQGSHAGIGRFEARRVEFIDGRMGMIVDQLNLKMTGQRTEEDVAHQKARLLSPPPQCAANSERVEGQETLFGYRAYRITSPIPAPAGHDVRYVHWDMPDFNCALVQMETQERDPVSGQWRPKDGKHLSAFAGVDPDAALFTGWEGYREMKPSDIKREFSRREGKTPDSCPACFSDDPSDTRYQEAHSRLAAAGPHPSQ